MRIHVFAAVDSGDSCHLPALQLAEPGVGSSLSRFLPLRSMLLISLLQSGSSSSRKVHSCLKLRVLGYVLAMCYTLRPGFRGRNVVNCTEPCCAISAKWLTWSFVNDSCTRIASQISLV
ncbi:hypothetical protein COCMIDRAFT_33085 [Bipolaris oryzae ATCC 44560]|uniref:Uncharacterized protein n=1 Tax=Bipolaris oryzae ATCC 44560 TaxID=930090 RepID=W6ZPM9_COCMI|nr:uncharacterized protein COCMIDRAFT_33085 [Bipolaris oryzae ATCC 44560]EUC49444.1 hypothetical protein COCMIDRAFT_33085 [Bipolaris oryzae ATCC 44560]